MSKTRNFCGSPAFNYRMSLEVEGLKEDNGVPLITSLRVLRAYGVCEEKLFPYPTEGKFDDIINKNITKEMLNNARKNRIASYDRLYSINEIKSALCGRHPVMIGLDWFEQGFHAEKGVLSIPFSRKTYVGRHAVVILGYDDEKNHFIFQNSWGTDWGDKGFGYVPYDYVKRFCGGAFVMHLAQSAKPHILMDCCEIESLRYNFYRSNLIFSFEPEISAL